MSHVNLRTEMEKVKEGVRVKVWTDIPLETTDAIELRDLFAKHASSSYAVAMNRNVATMRDERVQEWTLAGEVNVAPGDEDELAAAIGALQANLVTGAPDIGMTHTAGAQ